MTGSYTCECGAIGSVRLDERGRPPSAEVRCMHCQGKPALDISLHERPTVPDLSQLLDEDLADVAGAR